MDSSGCSSGKRAGSHAQFSGHRGPVRLALFGAEARGIVSAGTDGTIRIWDAGTGVERRRIDVSSLDVQSIALDADDARLFTSGGDGLVRIWSRTTGELLASLPGPGVPSRVVVARTGLFAAVFDDGAVMVWDSSSSRVRWQRQAHAGVGSAMAFDASGRLLATGGADGVVKVWDARSGRILRTFALDDGTVRSVAFDSAGRRVAAAGWWLATIWPIDDSSADVRSINVSSGLWDAQFSPDDHALATAHAISGSCGSGTLTRIPGVPAGAHTRAVPRGSPCAPGTASSSAAAGTAGCGYGSQAPQRRSSRCRTAAG